MVNIEPSTASLLQIVLNAKYINQFLVLFVSMASSYSTSSHGCKINHDVFVSFRGTDVRRGLLSHLKKEFCRRQIDVYIDERLERGDEIQPALLTAIEASQVLLVIFSKDYASSKWCLEELEKMIECMESNKQILIPVFYYVDPSDVRHQRGDYGDALAKHEETFKEKMVKVQNWRSTLKKAARLSGFHYPTNFEDESDLIDQIVEDVSKKLSNFSTSESSGLVGIHQNIAQIQSLLSMEPSEVRVIGIWGMGGIGKTTIAHAVFDKISLQYEGCCFLENIREGTEKHQLSYLREKLLSELSEGESLHTSGTSKARFFTSAKRILSRKKVFVVLDDVDTPEQLRCLIGEPICFGPGSRVIVTSRDKHVLASGGVHEVHEVKKLNFKESLELFCLNAFNETRPRTGYEELSKRVIANVKGIPLALKILGSYFHSKTKDIWECALKKLKQHPNEKIQSVLRLSYDGLDDVEKKIFLDIAFFFKDEDKDYVIRLLDAWGFYAACGIEALQQKALLTISNDNTIQMHDLIQIMGWKIVRQDEKYSRLRNNEEVHDALKNNWGTNKVEGMLIDLSQIRDLPLSVDTFKRMPNLRFVKFYYPLHFKLFMQPSHVKEFLLGVQDFVNSKRTDLGRSNLLLELPQFSKVSSLECAHLINSHSLHDLVKLETIKASRSKQPMEHRDLSEASKLNREDLLGSMEYESLCDGHPSIFSLETQVASILSGCEELMSARSEIHMKSLNYLLIDGCSGLKEFSVSSNELRQLKLTCTGMEILNYSIRHLSNFECPDDMDADGLQFKNLPSESFYLRSICYLKLSKSNRQGTHKPKLHILFDGLRYSQRISPNDLYNILQMAVPPNVSVFSWSCELRLDGSWLKSLSRSIQHLPWLSLDCPALANRMFLRTVQQPWLLVTYSFLNFEVLLELIQHVGQKHCRLRYLPELPSSVEYLYFTSCTTTETEVGDLSPFKFSIASTSDNLPKTNELPRMTSLTVLHIFNCRIMIEKQKLQIVFDAMRSLRALYLVDCCNLFELPDNIVVLSYLNELRLDKSSVVSLPPSIKHLPQLTTLSLWSCARLQSLPQLPPSIRILDALYCILLERVMFTLTIPRLQYAYITFQNCVNLVADEFNNSFRQYVRELMHGFLRSTRTGPVEWKYRFISRFRFCYPYNRLPEWFTYRASGSSITIELDPLSDDLFSYLLCVVLSPSKSSLFVHIECQSYLEDGTMPCVIHFQHQIWMDLYSDHVYMSFSNYCGCLLREMEADRASEHCTSSSYNPKLTFKFSFVGEHELEGLIKECGICPLYLSDYHNFVNSKRQRELEITEIGNGVGNQVDQEPLPPTKKLKELV